MTTMNLPVRTPSLYAYNMLLFRAAIHPEFFQIEGRTRIDHGEYEFEGWVFEGGHALRFEHDGAILTEVICDTASTLPTRGLAATMPCAGERDFEDEHSERITHMTSMQTETLSEHLFAGTYAEMLEHGQHSDGIMATWEDDEGRPNLSLIDTQRYSDEVHVQSYHLRSDCCMVLRSQSIFVTGVKKKDDEE